MKKNKNKGFTLIELLAVVVILLAVSVIAISSISAAIERNKKKQNDTKIAIIEKYAETYFIVHRNSINAGDKITLDKLNLSDSEIVDADGNVFCGYVDSHSFKFVYNDEYCPRGETITTTTAIG